MLPRLSDTALLRLAPDRAVLLRHHRGLHARTNVRGRELAAGTEALLAAVREELADLRPRTPVHVSLSNRLVRFALVPFSARVVGEAQVAMMARQAFRRVHGAVADQWAVSVSAAGERTRVAAAVDQDLKQGLIDAAAAAGVYLQAIDPLFMDAYNGARSHLLASGWFAVVEPGRVVLARTSGGDWMRLAAARCDGDWRATIERLVARERPWTEGDDERFCQVADYTGEEHASALAPELRVVSLANTHLQEAA